MFTWVVASNLLLWLPVYSAAAADAVGATDIITHVSQTRTGGVLGAVPAAAV